MAIPGKIVERRGDQGTVDFGGAYRQVNLSLVRARVGDYVIVHAGFAISKVRRREAEKTLELVRQIMQG